MKVKVKISVFSYDEVTLNYQYVQIQMKIRNHILMIASICGCLNPKILISLIIFIFLKSSYKVRNIFSTFLEFKPILV